ncbi:MAG: ATP-binding protein [Flavobacteriales bacterium]|nr:ATP-binding protein [Flavobacteriales bacterium]
MEEKSIKKSKHIVISGPESSGKTTLFEQLSNTNNCYFVPEHSRIYLNGINRKYNYLDILEIAKFQVNKLNLISKKEQLIISDTDLLTLLIWCEFKYKKCHQYIQDQLLNNLPDLYLLCNSDIPWEYDEQRENPDDRQDLFNIHLEKIKSLGVNYIILEGSEIERLNNAKKILSGFVFEK